MNKPKYQEGQVVKIKSFEELKANEYHLLYSDERLKEVADAEVAIYKVINDLRTITWYQVGQLGRNIIDIPEAYIKGDVLEFKAEVPADERKALEQSFFGFSNQLRATVQNGEYSCDDLECLLRECLDHVIARREKQKIETDRLIVRSLFINSEIKLGKIDLSNIKTSKLISDFNRVKEWLETHYELKDIQYFVGHYRILDKNTIIKGFEELLHDIKVQINNGHSNPLFDSLVALWARAVVFIVIAENPKELDREILTKTFYSATTRMAELFQRKNQDYGDSFFKLLDEDGLLVVYMRISEMINRYCVLLDNEGRAEVKSESIVDTLIDMANYCVMTIMWIEDQLKKESV
ncbi:nucleotide modification associated domain-containing protein [Bacteroides sp.]|uniref:nucleotide modification associated domain-containing protein n=1 Tax=Bacteroides sp. TaxID=29523 RepID=UPI002625C5AB|nr:nucleotide modification associated domain-containing protein [Bacteroides sp.]MDD3037943.1 nucleotide modification associated domain-containing protein [Bacteroides sp.]